jgi:hypothetical protein
MSIVGSDPLALLAIESGLIRAPLADAAAEGASKLDTEQLAAVLGEPVPIVFCRRDETAGTGGVLVSPPATEARFSNDANNAVTASYHLVLSEGRIGSIQVRDVFQRSCRVGSFSQTYDRRAGTWAPGNFVTLQAGFDLPICPYYCGTVGTYDGMSTLSFTATIPDGFDLWNRQVHAFIRNGMEVVRLVDGVTGSSNNFMDLALWAMTNCAKLQESQIDMASLRAASQFLSSNQLNCDIRITESGNLGDFLARLAPYFLLAETRLNGKRGFRPLLPINANGTIKTTAVSWRCVLTEAEILPDGFEISYVPVADRKPFCAQVIWRQQLTDDFGIIRTSEVRYAGEAVAGPFEQHDLSAFATREDHAVKVGAYIRARRKWVGHTARIRCRPMELPEGLAPGDLVRMTLQRTPSGTTASTHDLLYQIDTISPMGDAIELGATHFPVDAQGASLVALEVVSATGTGILLTSNRTGISCDINSSSDTSVPAEAFTEAEAIDDQVIMEPLDARDGNSGTGWSTYTYGYTQPPPRSYRGPNGGLYFHRTEWRGPYLAVIMRIDPAGRAPQPLTTPAPVEGAEPEPPYGGDLIASIESGLVVAVDASGDAISPQPSSLPALSVTGLVAHPWLSEYYPEAEFQAQPDPEQVFEATFLVPFKDSDFPSDPTVKYRMPITIKDTQGGFSEVTILNEAVAVFDQPKNVDLWISIIDEDDSYSPATRNADWAAFISQNPDGKLVLLIPSNTAANVGLPTGWTGDVYLVTRPGDDEGSTNYFALLNAYLSDGSVKYARISVDTSGSMDRDTVATDLNAFEAALTGAGIAWDEIPSPTEEWIKPHLSN